MPTVERQTQAICELSALSNRFAALEIERLRRVLPICAVADRATQNAGVSGRRTNGAPEHLALHHGIDAPPKAVSLAADVLRIMEVATRRAMERQLLFDGSSGMRCPLNTATRTARIGVSRHRIVGSDCTLATAPAQDAHLVIIQLKDQPAHDFWADGKHVAVPFTPRGTLGIVDLRHQSAAVFEAELDSLHIHLPRAALGDIAVDAGAAPVDQFAVENGWTIDDRVAQQLSPLLVAAIEDTNDSAQAYVDHIVLALATHVATTYGGMRRRGIRRGSLAPCSCGALKNCLYRTSPTTSV